MERRDLDENYQMLAHAIIRQAVSDYVQSKGGGKRVSRISKFFNSDWCNLLLEGSTLTGKDILNKLKSGSVVYQKGVAVIATKDGVTLRFNTIKEAADYCGTYSNSIRKCLMGKQKQANGWVFERIE